MVTEGGRGSRPLSAGRMAASPASPFAGGRPTERYHDTLLWSGRLPLQIPGRDGGGRDREDRGLKDGVNRKLLHRRYF